MQTVKIKLLQYESIHKGFYKAIAIDEEDKISLEGHICIGFLKELKYKTFEDGGKVERIKGLNLLNHEGIKSTALRLEKIIKRWVKEGKITKQQAQQLDYSL